MYGLFLTSKMHFKAMEAFWPRASCYIIIFIVDLLWLFRKFEEKF